MPVFSKIICNFALEYSLTDNKQKYEKVSYHECQPLLGIVVHELRFQ